MLLVILAAVIFFASGLLVGAMWQASRTAQLVARMTPTQRAALLDRALRHVR